MMNQQQGAMLCPNCRKLINRGERHCPYCGMTNPGSMWKRYFLTWGQNKDNALINAVIIINIGMYIISLLMDPLYIFSSFRNPLSFLSPASHILAYLGATGTDFIRIGRWWTLLSANYLHGGILHILFNMIAFRQLAPLVIREYGTYRTMIIYTIGGVTGFFISFLAGVRFTIGASAAICSLIGAAIYFGKSRGGAYGQAIYSQIGGWAISLFIFGFIVPGINNWGHGGGFIAGILLGFLMGYRERKKETMLHKFIAGGCVVLTILVLGWAVLTTFYYRFLG